MGGTIMKVARFFVKFIFAVSLILTVLIFSTIIYLQNNITDDYKVKKGDSLVINSKVPITAEFGGVELSQTRALSLIGENFEVNLKAFGIIPFSKVNVEGVDEIINYLKY